MDLRKLRHAVTLAEEGTYARAARRLNLTQPALSRSIQSLEAMLRLTLFDRAASGVRTTVDGERVLEHARTLLRQEASLLGEAAQLARGESGRVAFGVGPMLTPALGLAMAAVLGDGAQLDLRVKIEPVHVLERLLLDDRIDFFIADATRARHNAELQVRLLRSVPAGFFVRAGHPLAGRARLRPADIAGFPLASPSLGEASGFLDPAQSIACEDCHALKQVVLGSDAVMVGMNLSVEPELGAGRIVSLSGEGLFGHSDVGIVRRPARTLSAGALRIIDAFSAVLAEPGPGKLPP